MKNQLDTRKRLPASDVALVLNQGIAAQKAGDFRRAEFHYQTVLRDHPKDPDALSLQSTLAMEAGKLELAVQMLRKALKQRPREPVFLHNLAGALNKQGKSKQALDHLNKALKAKPDFVGAPCHPLRRASQSGQLGRGPDRHRTRHRTGPG
ncbi:tetratricopeptide repeat protein [Halovulum sp. GXIMD14793]